MTTVVRARANGRFAPQPVRACLIEGCGRPFYSRGWCVRHYTRWNRHGDPLRAVMLMDADPIERFRAFCSPPTATGCVEWQGALNDEGYGTFQVKGRKVFAHRWIMGNVPRTLQIDHLCRNRRCVNREHLEAVTPAVNTQRSYAARRALAALDAT